jgi:hypothetical protein
MILVGIAMFEDTALREKKRIEMDQPIDLALSYRTFLSCNSAYFQIISREKQYFV